ncbi:MAG: TIGR02757 family protein [Bacteroidia bacterium]|nr:TIGR02757 family protein [Bacteroidia bacterium]
MKQADLKSYLNQAVDRFNHTSFIEKDPISIPKQFSKKQDIEISGFWVAMLSWGQRVTIINKANELMGLMDHSPYEFIKGHEESDRKKFLDFKHRTFNDIDTLYFLEWLQRYYTKHDSLEDAFAMHMNDHTENVEKALVGFQDLFFSLPDAPQRTHKHVATPTRKSTCKRLNMFLRWMVRSDDRGVDFGIWKKIQPSQLVIPLDVHVDRVARSLGLIQRKQTDWQTAVELTNRLKQFNEQDPVIYDYALFGLGILAKDAERKP